MLTMYLAGAIRDDHQEDRAWREQVIKALQPYIDVNLLRIFSPLGGKHFEQATGKWTMSGVDAKPQHIVGQDFWFVDHSDIMVVNFLSLADGYQSLGTASEWGRSTATSKLRYVIWPTGVMGHENTRMFNVHPFITQNMTEMFPSVVDCIRFLKRHIPIVAGVKPQFDPPMPKNGLEMLPDEIFFNA